VKRILVVFRRDLKEMLSTTAFRIIAGFAAAVTVVAAVVIPVVLHAQPWYGVQEAAPLLTLITGLVIYFLPLLILISFIWAFTAMTLTVEKINGNIECLMATPLEPKSLWIGKSLAIFIPAYLLLLIATFIVLITINLSAFIPGWGTFILSPATLVTGLLINPLLLFALLLFIVLYSLADNPDIAAAPALLVGFALMVGMPAGLMTGAFDINSWIFALCYLVITAVIWIIVMFMTRMLTRQNIVLSSKGS